MNNPCGAPWANTEVLAGALRNGEISLSNAIRQAAAVSRESYKIIEDYSAEAEKFYQENRNKISKNEKLISDLTEKCQAMQQALLYKEEKYHEKCREVERYKVICEMSSRAAINDDICVPTAEADADDDFDNFILGTNNKDGGTNDKDINNNDINIDNIDDELANENEPMPDNPERPPSASKKNLRHVKLTTSQLEAKQLAKLHYDAAKASALQRASATGLPGIYPDSFYMGGPCKRIKPRPPLPGGVANIIARSLTATDKMRLVGGIVGAKSSATTNTQVPNFSGTNLSRTFNPSATQLSRTNASQPANMYGSGGSKDERINISLGGQSNEVMSSLRNISHDMKQKIVEKDLHRQVAEGGWTRIARRKKGWPF